MELHLQEHVISNTIYIPLTLGCLVVSMMTFYSGDAGSTPAAFFLWNDVCKEQKYTQKRSFFLKNSNQLKLGIFLEWNKSWNGIWSPIIGECWPLDHLQGFHTGIVFFG